jgi:hypothetical protein
MKPLTLSYSSAKTLQSCQHKYYLYKIANAPVDSDYEESDALGFGKAFHQVLEKTNHESYSQALIDEACLEHKVDEAEKPLLTTMLKKYVEYHKASGLKVVKCELRIETSTYLGFIDAIAIDDSGFWIIDLKTAGRFDETLLSRLPKDMQLNLYSYFAKDIEIAVEAVKDLPFKGCRYRAVIKSKAGTQAGLEKGVKVYDIEVPISMMDPESSWNLLQENHDIAKELHAGVAPKRNYDSCMSYFKPCQYFSQCHGEIFSKANSKVKVHTIETLTDGDLL